MALQAVFSDSVSNANKIFLNTKNVFLYFELYVMFFNSKIQIRKKKSKPK